MSENCIQYCPKVQECLEGSQQGVTGSRNGDGLARTEIVGGLRQAGDLMEHCAGFTDAEIEKAESDAESLGKLVCASTIAEVTV